MGFETLYDDSKMPFGKHKGKLMQDVPVNYLHWFWHNGDKQSSVGLYIKENINAFKLENKDLIWS